MSWTDATGSVSTIMAKTAGASLPTEVQEFSGVKAGAPLSSSATSGDSQTASGTATTGDLEVGVAAGHGNAEGMTPTSGFTPQARVPSIGSSIVSLLTGYETRKLNELRSDVRNRHVLGSGLAVFPNGCRRRYAQRVVGSSQGRRVLDYRSCGHFRTHVRSERRSSSEPAAQWP
jgi:hypothetical protein